MAAIFSEYLEQKPAYSEVFARIISMEEARVCPDCGERKPLSDYWKSSRTALGVQVYCKACQSVRRKNNAENNRAAGRRWYLKRGRYVSAAKRYGLTIDQYMKLIEKGSCDICGEVTTRTTVDGATWLPHIDHDHNTGEVRGVLCNTCNAGLGMFKDDPKLLKMAISYLGGA